VAQPCSTTNQHIIDVKIAMENGPFIDDFPLKPPFMVGIFHGYVK